MQNFLRPAAIRDIQHQCAGGVGHVDGPLSGEAEANVVLGQHDGADPLPVLRFVLPYPQKFRQSEIGQRWIAGEPDESFRANSFGKIAALFFAAQVAPDERRPNDFVGDVQHDGAMHLSGKSDARDLIRLQAGVGQSLPHGDAAGAPPVFRILFGPSDLRRGEGRVFFGRGRNDASVFTDNQGARTTGAYVDSENMCLHFFDSVIAGAFVRTRPSELGRGTL